MKYYEHPAYIGYANEIPEDDKRHKDWEQQFNECGWDDTAIWNLDVTIAQFILPRLTKLYERRLDLFIFDEDDKEHLKDMDIMIKGFTLLSKDVLHSTENSEKITQAFEALSRQWGRLWL